VSAHRCRSFAAGVRIGRLAEQAVLFSAPLITFHGTGRTVTIREIQYSITDVAAVPKAAGA
jgi:hypothetical protein